MPDSFDDYIAKFEKDLEEELNKQSFGFSNLADYEQTLEKELLTAVFEGPPHVFGARAVAGPKQVARHMLVAGSTQFGKSRFIQYRAQENILEGAAVFVADPHGGVQQNLLGFCAKHDVRKVCVIHPRPGASHYASFNPLKLNAGELPEACAGRVADAIVTAWGETLREEKLLRTYLPQMLYCLIANQLTLAELPFFLQLYNQTRHVILTRTAHLHPGAAPLRILAELYSAKRPLVSFGMETQSTRNRTDFLNNPIMTYILGEGRHSVS